MLPTIERAFIPNSPKQINKPLVFQAGSPVAIHKKLFDLVRPRNELLMPPKIYGTIHSIHMASIEHFVVKVLGVQT